MRFTKGFLCGLLTLILISGGVILAVTNQFADDVRILDDKTLNLGTDDDIQIGYDETSDNRLEISDGTNLLAAIEDMGTTGKLTVNGDGYFQDVNVDGGNLNTAADDLTIGDGTSSVILAADSTRSGNALLTTATDANALAIATGKTNAPMYLQSNGSGGVRVNYYGGTGGLKVYAGGASPTVEVASISSAGALQCDSNIQSDGVLIGTLGTLALTSDNPVANLDGICFNAASSQIEFYIDGTLVGHIGADGAYTDDVAP